MPYTTLVAGNTITASWANASVRDQVVTPFATAAARDSAIVAPLEGMLCMLMDSNDYWYYTGAAWALAFAPPMLARRTTDATPSNADVTLDNDSVISFSVVANAVYRLEGRLKYMSATAADFKIGWTFPSGLTMDFDVFGIAAATAAPLIYPNTQVDTPILEGAGVATAASVWLEGTVIVSSTAGTLQLQTAQGTSNGSNTVLKAQSYVQLTRMS